MKKYYYVLKMKLPDKAIYFALLIGWTDNKNDALSFSTRPEAETFLKKHFSKPAQAVINVAAIELYKRRL